MDDYLKDYPAVLTPENIMEIMSLGKNKIYDLLKEGTIKSIRIGHQYRIPQQYMHEFLFNSIRTNA